MLRIEIPLSVGNTCLCRLVLLKNLTWEPVHPYTLRRVEHLRRAVMGAMSHLYSVPARAPMPAPTLAASGASLAAALRMKLGKAPSADLR
jgi:hypothetical protein